jgi:iron complex outermembrane receptor protein
VLHGQEETYQAWYGVPAQYAGDAALRTYNVAGTEKPGAPYDDQVDHYTQRHHLLHYNRAFGGGLFTVQLNGHYTRGYGYYEQYQADEDRRDYGLPPLDSLAPLPDLVRRLWLDNHFYGATYAVRWTPAVNPPGLAGAPEFLLGGAVSRYEGQHFGEVIWSEYSFDIPKDYRYYENDADKRDGNVFLKIQTAFRGGLTTFLDLQYRRVGYTFLGFDRQQQEVDQSVALNFFNPKGGLSWAFAPAWTVHAFFGVANREPNRDDYTQSTPASRPLPERLYDGEAGVKIAGRRGFAGLNAFYMYYRDQLALDGRLNDVGAYIRTNLPQSYRAGIEFEGRFDASEHWQLGATAALSRNRVRRFTEYIDNWDTGGQETVEHRDADLAFSPNVIARGEIRWQPLPAGRRHALALTLAGKYVGRQFLDNTSNASAQLPAYFTADLRLNYDLERWLGERVSVIVALNNLFDARYANNGWVYRYVSPSYDARPDDPYTRLEGGDVYHQAGFFPQAGRNWMATVVLNF